MQQVGQRRARVAEQADHAFARAPRPALGSQPGVAVETGACLDEPDFADQPAGAGHEARIEEPLAQAAAGAVELRRRQAVVTLHVALRAEVLQIDPQRCRLAPRHALDEFGRRVAAEGFDDHLARLQRGWRCGPRHQRHARCALGRHPGQRAGVVDPQPHRLAARGQVGRQAPAHADVAVVVDDATEDIPGRRCVHAVIIEGGRIDADERSHADPRRHRDWHARGARAPARRGGGAARPARRLSLLRRARRGALRRQGAQPEEARVQLLPQGPRRHAHRPHGDAHRAAGNHGGAHRGRGAAAREQPDQDVEPEVQHPVPRRQELPLPEDHRHARCGAGHAGGALSARGLLPRQRGPQAPLLRPVPRRLGGEGNDPADPEGVPPAHLRRHGLRQPLAALPAVPDPTLLGSVRRPGLAGRLRAGRAQRRALPARRAAAGDRRTAAADDGLRRRAGLRAGGRVARPHRGAVAGAAPAVGGGQQPVGQRPRRRHPGGARGGRSGLRQPGDGARQPPPGRPRLLPGPRGRGHRHRRR